MEEDIKRIVILPYFGKFNCYFKLWLSSCAKNKNIDWLIITDTPISYEIPDNVRIILKSFANLKQDFQKKFDFKIVLDKPYKLCDYKQFYGFLLAEYLEGYDFWGYCDCDLIFGDIDSFLPKELFYKYDKVLRTGHLSFVRNNKNINELFKKYDTYKIALSSSIIYGYDESVEGFHLGFAGELLDNGYKFYSKDELIADIDFRHFPFYVVTRPEKACVFLYDKGKTYRIERAENKEIIKTEVMYVHLQKRKMKVKCNLDAEQFLIIPNAFISYDNELLMSDSFWNDFTKEKAEYFNFVLEKRAARKRDMMRFLHEPHKLDSLLFRLSSKWRDR